MRASSVALALLAVVAVSAQPGPGTLRIKITLADAAQAPTPVQRHGLLLSDNPPSAEPRLIFTAADGTVVLTLRPGSYIVESDRPVVFGGRAYQWTQYVEIVGGRDLSLDLTTDNAEIVPLEALPSPTSASASREDLLLLSKYQESVVTVWSPTAQASGFVVDSRGLIATDGRAVGTATVVEVQFAPTVKVPGRVLHSERSRDIAIVRVDPSLVANHPALALACPPARAPSLDDGQAIASITVPRVGEKELVNGEVTTLHPRRVETDLRVPVGGSGGPVFNDAGAVVGLTSITVEPDSRPDDAAVIPTVFICEALAASLPMLSGAETLTATRLPVEPTQPYPAGTLEDIRGATPNVTVPVMSSSDFDVAFLTPPMVHRARQRSGWTGGRIDRSPEAEARLGRLTEFGAWSDYFSTLPAVLIVRVSPKMVEGFWKRLGREAAATQGAMLPPFKDFKASFRRMRAMCAGVEVTPIHPFVLEHHMTEKNVIREGLYVFDPGAFGPQCGTVTLSLYSEAQPERADTLTPARTVIDQIWNDFAPYRATGR